MTTRPTNNIDAVNFALRTAVNAACALLPSHAGPAVYRYVCDLGDAADAHCARHGLDKTTLLPSDPARGEWRGMYTPTAEQRAALLESADALSRFAAQIRRAAAPVEIGNEELFEDIAATVSAIEDGELQPLIPTHHHAHLLTYRQDMNERIDWDAINDESRDPANH